MRQHRNILYLTYDGLSDPLGQSQVLPYLTGLSRLGHKITIVSSEKKTNPGLIRKISDHLEKEGIAWINIPYTKSPPILSTIYDTFRMRNACIRLIRNQKFDIVHCRSYITSLIGHELKRRFGLRFIFDTRGLYADERIDGAMWDQHKLIYKAIYRFFKNKEAAFLSRADYTICLTEDAKKEMHSWKSIPNQPIPIQVIPCCADTNLFNNDSISAERRKQLASSIGLTGDELILSYVGAVGTWYMLEEMLDFFKQLKIKFPDARFLFITHEDPSFIMEKAMLKEIDARNIIITKANHADVPAWLSLSHLSIFFIKPVYSKLASSPAKQGEIMSMGIPIICNTSVGDTERVIRSSHAGAVIRNFTPDDYAFVIEEIPTLLSLDKATIRKFAIERFSLERGIAKYNEVYTRLTPSE